MSDDPHTAARARLRWAALVTVVAVAAAAAAAAFSGSTVSRVLLIAAPTLAAAIVTAVAVWRGSRWLDHHASRQQNEVVEAQQQLRDEQKERASLRELDRALDHAPDERVAVEMIHGWFERHLGGQPMELHLVDAVEPLMTRVVATGDHPTNPPERSSPWDSLAARTGTTLSYDSTNRSDVCPHLRGRVSVPSSAVAVPVLATGQLLGVLYGFGSPDQQPGEADVQFLEDMCSVIAARIAILRTTGTAADLEAVDRLTSLPDRPTTQNRLVRLLKDRVPFTVAVADIDGFRGLNAEFGRIAGDDVLTTLAGVARRTIRPDDVLGRIGGDELLFVFPRAQPDDATRAIERLREELVLDQSMRELPSFTISVGVVGSSAARTIDEILHLAADALQHAKDEGGNRVIVAAPVPKPT